MMGVLNYIKKKYAERKIMNTVMKPNNCDHNFEVCKCLCHTTRGMMHIINCCSQVQCEKCGIKYNKKLFTE